MYHNIRPMADSTTEKVQRFVRENGIVRARELEEEGYPTALLYRLRDRGDLRQLGPGLFMHPDAEVTEHHSYAVASKLVPDGIICLLSALAFHEIGTQLPSRIWMAIESHSRRPAPSYGPKLRFAWYSGPAFHEGWDAHQVEGVEVRVYSPAKTVADLFKYRKKVGVGVAVEALHEAWRDRLFTMEELMHYAEICRVKTVIRPYVQSLVAAP